MAGLPWEMVYETATGRFLALSERTPVVRYLQLSGVPQPFDIRGPLRVLAILSSPAGFEPLAVDAEWERMQSALKPQVVAGLVTLDRLFEPSLDELHRYLRTHDVNVLHLVGHGNLDSASNTGVFYLQRPDGRAHAVTSREIGPDLHDHDPLRLVVLNACQTAAPGRVDVFSGLGQGLARQWVPAVVAMQVPISDRAAVVFCHDFYLAIATGQPVDQALTGARKALHIDFPEEWATPVLFLRAADGGLFTRSPDSAHEEAPASARLVIGVDGRFVGNDREAATDTVFALLDQPVTRRSVAVHALPLDDAEYRVNFPDAYARLRAGVSAYQDALGLLFNGRVRYSVKWTMEQLVEAVLELRAICLPAQYDRQEWYSWPTGHPSDVVPVRLDERWVDWFRTGAFRWTDDEYHEPIDGIPPDAPLWLTYVHPALVWGRVVPALLARLAAQESIQVVTLDDWVISNHPPSELPRAIPIEPNPTPEVSWSWDN